MNHFPLKFTCFDVMFKKLHLNNKIIETNSLLNLSDIKIDTFVGKLNLKRKSNCFFILQELFTRNKSSTITPTFIIKNI